MQAGGSRTERSDLTATKAGVPMHFLCITFDGITQGLLAVAKLGSFVVQERW